VIYTFFPQDKEDLNEGKREEYKIFYQDFGGPEVIMRLMGWI